MSEYFIGLDIGTESVGWAVTDTEYHVLKKNGKALWGVRLFSEAQKAADRRAFRTNRRRLERRNQRIEWIRRIFNEEIAKVDPAFFMRLDESKFLEQDKHTMENGQPLGRYTLFADKNYCDKDYHCEFPTIYHLRKALMFEEREFDVRLVYLAVHHIMKKRGHFLFTDVNIEDVTFENCLKDLQDYLLNEYEVSFCPEDTRAFVQALTDRTMNITRKKSALKKAAGIDKQDEQLSAIIDLLAGAKVKPSVLCALELTKEEDTSFSFKDNFENIETALGDSVGEGMNLILLAKRIYDWALLDELKKGESFISCAKVKTYEEHKDDLVRLKKLFKADSKAYKAMFRTAEKKLDNYPAYSGHGAQNYCCDYAKFSAYAKKQIKAILPKLNKNQQEEAQKIIDEFDLGTFLPKQTNKDNGVIPHQLYEQELQIILDRAGRYLPFLNEKDGNGLSRKEQLLAIFRFRIPYYVGPLCKIRDTEKASKQNCWIVRNDEQITPWNFEKVVDLSKSAEKFIERMTATCSYLGEPVLPKDSLLYSKFVALNMINKIQINGHPISVETKQRIFNEHLLAQGKSNGKALKQYMLSCGLMQKEDELGGIDDQFKLSLTGYKVFRRLLSGEGTYFMVEDIIRHILLFGEDRKLLSSWLANTYGGRLSKEDQEYVLRNRSQFTGWGNLSEAFLTRIEHTDPDTGEILSVIDALWETNYNLMELLSSEYSFTQSVENYREEKYQGKKRTLDDVLKDSYASPGIRRAIRQTMGIVSEIEKIMQGQPKRVFVEVTRSEGEKARIPSRKRQLDELYAACRKEAPDVFSQLQDCDEAALRSAKLYLYFTQLGKCMYSGEPIDLSRLAVDYDIDHIHPQSVVKDDSLHNRVLVKRELNAAKGDQYPLSDDIHARMHPLWHMLRSKKLISEEKYRRLTRKTPFSDSERSGFIARQLVETSQSSKIVAELLKNRYEGNDRVVYVKAGNVSSFRQDQRILEDGTQLQAWACKGVQTKQDPLFVKCRDVNDFHHAKDAYLNIVVGNVYHVKFTRNPLRFIQSQQKYSMNRMFDFDVVRGNECAWRKGEEGSIAVVRKTMRKNNILFTRYAHEVRGGLFDQMIMPKGQGQTPIKRSDPRMTVKNYGGYNKRTGTYFMLVEHTEKKKRVRSIETVFLMDKALFECDPIAYCKTILGLQEPRILISRIPIDSLVSYDGFRMHVSGRTGTQIIYKNANQLVVSPEQVQYIKQISKYLERCRQAKTDLEINKFDGITAEENNRLYQLLLDKLNTNLYRVKYATASETIVQNYAKFTSLEIAQQCRILMQILNLFNTTAASADLKELCGKVGIGILLTSKNLSNYTDHNFKLIHQSITGFFEQEINLLGDAF